MNAKELKDELLRHRECLCAEAQTRLDQEMAAIEKARCWDNVASVIGTLRLLQDKGVPCFIKKEYPEYISVLYNVCGLVRAPILTVANCEVSLDGTAETLVREHVISIYSNEEGEKTVERCQLSHNGRFHIEVLANREAERWSMFYDSIGDLDYGNLPLNDPKAFNIINGFSWFGVSDKWIDTWQIEAVEKIQPKNIRQLAQALFLAFHREVHYTSPEQITDRDLQSFLGRAESWIIAAYLKSTYPEEFQTAMLSNSEYRIHENTI